MRKAILNLHSTKPTAPRFCDVIVEGESITLEVKQDKNQYNDVYREEALQLLDKIVKMYR